MRASRNPALPGRAALRFAATTALVVAGLFALGHPAPAAEPNGGYHLSARFPVGGTDTGYDYLRVDAASRRLFVAHGSHVEVLDADTGARLGQVSGVPGVHGIEIIDSLHAAFATGGADRQLVVFDPQTLAVTRRIKYLGVKPDALQYDPASGLLFVVNGGSTGDVSVIDPASGAIVDTLELSGGKLEEIAFDGQGRGFVNDEEKNLIHVFDSRTRKLIGQWPLGPAEGPTGLAIDRAHHRLFAACGNKLLAVVDASSGALLETTAIGPEPDGAAFDAQSGKVFTSNRDGTLSVLAETTPGHFSLVQTVKTATGARTLALDEQTGRLFLPAGEFGAKPKPTAAVPEPRAPLVPGSFAIVVVAP